ncbi:MAG: flagellar filament capping protein FliD [Lachnospiraceae bacterium]|nr:flagellar filament capping protein FliD [Lachnospiraceae bacterium]
MSFNINGDTSNYMNNFFSGFNSNNNVGGSTNFLSDWYSVQNGSYYKVAKKYYAQENADAKEETSATDDKQLELAKESAEASVKAINTLMDDSLYEKVKKTDEKGNTTYDYDKDAILDNVKSFVEKYNGLIENTGKLEDTSTLKSGVRLVNQTEVYEGALAKVGITIREDNTLEIDEDAFGKANMSDVKSLFTGSVSFAKNMQTKFLQIYSNASHSTDITNSLYNSTGNYQKSVANMFDSVL